MRVITVDDEELILERMLELLGKMEQITELQGFTLPSKAWEYAQNHPVDVAFLDIQMRGMDGITLAQKLKLLYPDVNIIFMTGFSEYSLDAVRLHASGYLLKPPSLEDIKAELADLRRPVSYVPKKRINIQCFGNFECYIDGEPCTFRYAKTKELLAYLVDRNGSMCTNGELMAILWEDESEGQDAYLRNLVSDLRNYFKMHDCEDALIKKRGLLAIVPDKVYCDYYEWMDGNPEVVNRYHGEYMSQYSWAEVTFAGMFE